MPTLEASGLPSAIEATRSQSCLRKAMPLLATLIEATDGQRPVSSTPPPPTVDSAIRTEVAPASAAFCSSSRNTLEREKGEGRGRKAINTGALLAQHGQTRRAFRGKGEKAKNRKALTSGG